ncbi:hypothetical protein C8Q77DRAFT_1130004 [Trametes polyzona]|nr:hypothetical protein C8Q77DRAFT_1130004 [Trametes polyzona]
MNGGIAQFVLASQSRQESHPLNMTASPETLGAQQPVSAGLRDSLDCIAQRHDVLPDTALTHSCAQPARTQSWLLLHPSPHIAAAGLTKGADRSVLGLSRQRAPSPCSQGRARGVVAAAAMPTKSRTREIEQGCMGTCITLGKMCLGWRVVGVYLETSTITSLYICGLPAIRWRGHKTLFECKAASTRFWCPGVHLRRGERAIEDIEAECGVAPWTLSPTIGNSCQATPACGQHDSMLCSVHSWTSSGCYVPSAAHTKEPLGWNLRYWHNGRNAYRRSGYRAVDPSAPSRRGRPSDLVEHRRRWIRVDEVNQDQLPIS